MDAKTRTLMASKSTNENKVGERMRQIEESIINGLRVQPTAR